MAAFMESPSTSDSLLGDFTLGKPPIAEAWIGLRFEPRQDSPSWTPEIARQFFLHFQKEYPELEFERKEHVQIASGSPTELPKVTDRRIDFTTVRGQNDAKTEWLQLTSDKMILNMVAAGDYPGFPFLRDRLLSNIPTYCNFFQPLKVRAAAIFYMDVIEIPAVDKIELNDYFVMSPSIPSRTFGDITDFSYRNVFECPTDEGPLYWGLRPLPSSEDGAFRFRMTWQKVSNNIDTLDPEIITARLNESHKYVRRCFKECLTEQTWKLFDPK